MYVVNYSVDGDEALGSMLANIRKVPANKMRKVLNWWRFTLANQINASLSGGTVNRRTSKLFKSADPHKNLTIVEKGDGVFLVQLQGEVAVYGKSLEIGATIEPKEKEWLAVPLGGKGYGNKRATPLTRYKKKFFLRSKFDTNELVAYWKKSKKEIVPIFVLKKQVKLAPFPWFKNAIKKAIPSFREQVRKA